MKNIRYLLLFILILPQLSNAQNKMLTMEDAIIKSRTSLAPKKLTQLMWVKGTNDYSYVDTFNSKEVIMRGTASNGDVSGNAKPKNLAKEYLNLVWINKEFRMRKMDTLKHFPAFTWMDKDHFTFEADKKIWIYDGLLKVLSIDGFKELPETAENMDVEPNTGATAYTIDNNLFILKDKYMVSGYEAKVPYHRDTLNLQVTRDADKNIVNGKAVHRDEFGITKGTFWSPQGTYLAFYRMDQTMVDDYPVVDWSVKPAKANIIKYPMAGGTSHQVTIGIFNPITKTKVFLKTGEPADQYLTNIAWSPDEKHLYIAVLNRDQNHLKFNSYNVATGDFEKTLFEEKNDKYVQPMHPMVFVPNHPDLFVWQSCKDGYNHLYLYDVNGKLVRQLTKGNWEVTNFSGFDPKGTFAYYSSTEGSPITRSFFKVDVNDGTKTQLTSSGGTHTETFNENGEFFIDNLTSLEVPRILSIINNKGITVQTLLVADNPLKEYNLGKEYLTTIRNEHGDGLYCRIFKPSNFDSTKKYPVIDYMYGGPNVQLVNDVWPTGNELWFQYMAERGFVVFTLDNRGSANRGKDFEQATFRKLGTEEMNDQLEGVKFLKNIPWVDTNRIGIHGWSFGGFMTVSMMTRNPGIFKVAVAGGPVIDWSYYEVMYTERYMDTPKDNKEGYEKSNLLNYVDKLKGKMMLIHGTSDDVVVWQHSLDYLKVAVDNGVQVDYFVYPGHQHNVLGKDRVHLMNKITDYFMQNL